METPQLKQSQIAFIKDRMESLEQLCDMIRLHLNRGADGSFMLSQYQVLRDERYRDLVSYIRRIKLSVDEKDDFISFLSTRFFPDNNMDSNPRFRNNPILKAIA